MEFRIQIAAVDGTTFFTTTVSTLRDAFAFLRKRDHEGSSVSAQVTAESGEDVYTLLRALDKGLSA